MIKFDKNSRFLFYGVSFLFILNLALLYKINYVLQILGLILLCIIPGYLLCLLFEIKTSDIYEDFLYIIGISIIFDFLFGLVLNTLLPLFGYNKPLSSQSLQICFSMLILILLSLIVYTNKTPIISPKRVEISKTEKTFLIFGFLILLCCLIGVYLVNIYSSNVFLIFSILLIPVLLFSLIIFYNDSIKRIYPIIIYLLSFSLLMLLTLRSNYIIGVDSHEEYYFFLTTLFQSLWIPNPNFLLGAALSISIVPTIFQNFLAIDPQLLFKLLFPLIFSITPLIIFVIVKKYANELLAFVASCFFMFQDIFILTTYNSRTSIAIFFFAFAILIISNRELLPTKKYALLLLFIAGMIFSHYTSSYIFLFLITFAYSMDLLLSGLKKRKENRFVNLPVILFSVGLIYFWYVEIISIVFYSGMNYTTNRITILYNLANNDLSQYTFAPARHLTSLEKIAFLSKFLIVIIICFGILFAFFYVIQKRLNRNLFLKFPMNMDRTFLFMGVLSCGLLVCTIFAPLIFFGYGIDRLSELLFVILSVFLIIGGCSLFNLALWGEKFFLSKLGVHKKTLPLNNCSKSNQVKIVSGILMCLLIPQLFVASYVINQFDQGPYSIIFNSPDFSKNNIFGFSYVYDQEAYALQWFKNNTIASARIYSDEYGNKKITSITNLQSSLYQSSLTKIKEEDFINGYTFLTVTNEYYHSFFGFNSAEIPISKFEPILDRKNKIFANGAVILQ